MRFALVFLTCVLAVCLMPSRSGAGVVEISAGGSYSRSQYSENSYTWSRKLGASVGYHFNDRSGFEFSFADSIDRTSISGFEDTTTHDKVYGVSWVQALTGKDYPIQPYFKLGVGQLNREATGSYALGASPPTIVDSVTGIGSLGIKIYLAKGFGIRAEFTTFLAGGSIGTWNDNISTTVGISVYF
jgi:hypothetical protein